MIVKILLLILLLATLPGCATTPGAPVVTEVQIPVAEAPIDTPMPDKPAFAVDALPLGSSIDAQMRALRAERQQRIGYEIRLEDAARACR